MIQKCSQPRWQHRLFCQQAKADVGQCRPTPGWRPFVYGNLTSHCYSDSQPKLTDSRGGAGRALLGCYSSGNGIYSFYLDDHELRRCTFFFLLPTP